MKYKIKPPMV